jgi:glycosyltransferase involved in cell wall biosynthesis
VGGRVFEGLVKLRLKTSNLKKYMKVAILCTNLFTIDEKNKTGSGIFDYILIHQLAGAKRKNLDVTVFASGESSSLPAKVESVGFLPSSADPKMIQNNKHIMFELALLSKAFSQQGIFDVYHVNIGDGDLIMPFAIFVKKPIVVTLHNIINEEFTQRYFSLFNDRKNVFFVSLSNYQRKMLPMLQYIDTIYHGIDTEQFGFNPVGGNDIMWAGRFIPEKGSDVAFRLAKELGHRVKLFGIIKNGYEDWFRHSIEQSAKDPQNHSFVSLNVDFERRQLIPHFQNSKLFLLPTLFEEAFGLVFAESMACGTPVVTFARGAAPEVIRDGVTGLLVNPGDDDIRGDWVIKKTGFAGLCEAVEKIYSLSDEEYSRMRKACREHAVQYFSAEQMAKKYIEVYEKVSVKK